MAKELVVTDEGDEDEDTVLDPSGMNPFEDKKILVRRNDIFLYKSIDDDLAREFADQLEAMYLNLLQICISTGLGNPRINLHLCSAGGGLEAGFAIIESMKDIQTGLKPFNIPMAVDTYIEGNADSCASLIACCGSRRYISKYAGSVIHGLSGGAEGKNRDIQTIAQNLTDMEKVYKSIYLSHSKLTEEELDAMLKEERRYTPDFLFEKGLVDEITSSY